MGVNSEKLHDIDGGDNSADSENWVIAGIGVRSPLKPIFTKKMEKSDEEHEEEEEEYSTTPTFAESRIPIRFACPPAPKKRKQASSRCQYNYGGVVREFFNPPDLETIFTRRVEGA